MNQYDFDNAFMSLTNNAFVLNDLIKLNIIKEMWNLLTIEEKKELTVKTYNKMINSIAKTSFGTININDIFSLINKEQVIKNVFVENNQLIIDSIKNLILDKIKYFISEMGKNSDILNLIQPEILKIVKNSYQNILSYQGDLILKETKALIIKVTSEQSIINYGQKLIERAKKIVDEEIIKELIE